MLFLLLISQMSNQIQKIKDGRNYLFHLYFMTPWLWLSLDIEFGGNLC